MIRNKFKPIISLILAASMLTACGSTTGPATTKEFNAELEDSVYYVVNKHDLDDDIFSGYAHYNEKGEKVATLTTFEGVDVTPTYLGDQTDGGNILWFRKDYDNIPTLYAGDFLVMYTNQVLTETITFKRYEDTGYSIGLCNLSQTPSNRCMIDLSEQDFNITYPESDTDKLLNLTNESVILEALGGSPLRFEDDDSEKQYVDGELVVDENARKPLITQYGTLYLDEISPCMEMDALVYEGTVKHEYTFTSDVRIFGLMDEYSCHDFEFISETIMMIRIPEWFNSGYYMINDSGFFRYVKETTNYTEKYGSPGTRPADIDFNVPNVNPEKLEDEQLAAQEQASGQNTPVASEEAYFYSDEIDDQYAPVSDDVRTDILSTKSAGHITITAIVEVPDASAGALPAVTITLTTPTGRTFPFEETDEEGVYEIEFQSYKEGEEYYVRTYNLDGREVRFVAKED